MSIYDQKLNKNIPDIQTIVEGLEKMIRDLFAKKNYNYEDFKNFDKLIEAQTVYISRKHAVPLANATIEKKNTQHG